MRKYMKPKISKSRDIGRGIVRMIMFDTCFYGGKLTVEQLQDISKGLYKITACEILGVT
jgi:hypothetical protein